jgi:hypothetical protein
MSHHILIAESYGSMLWAPEVPCLIVRFHGFVNLQQYQQLMNQGLDLYQRKAQNTRATGWIADTRQLSALPAATQEWLASSWNPRAYAAGLRCISFVRPETIFGQIAMQLYSANTEASAAYSFDVRQHDSLSKALHAQRLALQALSSRAVVEQCQ